MNDFIQAILTLLRGVTDIQHVAIYNQQYERINSGNEDGEEGYLFAMPAVFVEFDFSTIQLLGQGYQLYDPTIITLHIVMQELDAGSGLLDQNTNFITLRNNIFLALEKKYVAQSGLLIRTSEAPDYGHNNLYVFKQTYTTTFVDAIGKDPINGVTLQPPINFNITNTI